MWRSVMLLSQYHMPSLRDTDKLLHPYALCFVAMFIVCVGPRINSRDVFFSCPEWLGTCFALWKQKSLNLGHGNSFCALRCIFKSSSAGFSLNLGTSFDGN